MILISAHLDRVRNGFKLTYRHGHLTGLLDNILGVATVYYTLLDDPNIARLEVEDKIRIWHNQSEEWGELDETCPKLDPKKDMVIVVDVCSSKEYKNLDFSIENVANISKPMIGDIRYFMKSEGFKTRVKEYTGKPEEADEAWQFRDLKVPVVSFILPIVSPKDGWHRIQDDSSIDLERWRVACEGLKRLICYFHE